MYGYYSTFLDGRMTYSEWMELTPKERDYAIESQEEIRKIKNTPPTKPGDYRKKYKEEY